MHDNIINLLTQYSFIIAQDCICNTYGWLVSDEAHEPNNQSYSSHPQVSKCIPWSNLIQAHICIWRVMCDVNLFPMMVQECLALVLHTVPPIWWLTEDLINQRLSAHRAAGQEICQGPSYGQSSRCMLQITLHLVLLYKNKCLFKRLWRLISVETMLEWFKRWMSLPLLSTWCQISYKISFLIQIRVKKGICLVSQANAQA